MQPVPFTTVSAGEIPRPSTPDLETASGGSDRFNREVVAHLNSLYRFALRKTRNQQEAEDLVQDTLLRALEFQHRLQPGSNCRAWLFTIMHNLFVNRIRKSSLSLVDFDEKQAHRERALGAWLPDNPEEPTGWLRRTSNGPFRPCRPSSGQQWSWRILRDAAIGRSPRFAGVPSGR